MLAPTRVEPSPACPTRRLSTTPSLRSPMQEAKAPSSTTRRSRSGKAFIRRIRRESRLVVHDNPRVDPLPLAYAISEPPISHSRTAPPSPRLSTATNTSRFRLSSRQTISTLSRGPTAPSGRTRPPKSTPRRSSPLERNKHRTCSRRSTTRAWSETGLSRSRTSTTFGIMCVHSAPAISLSVT